MKKGLSVSLILASLGLLMSCSPGNSRTEKISKVDLNFPLEYTNEAPEIEGATYTIAMVTSSPFKGIFSPLHYQDNNDGNIIQLINEEYTWKNEDFEILDVEGGIATLSLDTEKNQMVIKFKEGLKWSDGHPMGVDDLIYTFEVVAHPDYTGVRFSPIDYYKIKGLKEYNEGKASKISGLEKISDTELRINVDEISSKVITGGGPLVPNLLPKHDLENIPVKDLEYSDKIRKNPVGNGKYVIKNIVPGESIELVPNEYYHLGKPKVAKIILKTINPQLAVESLKNGDFFQYLDLPQDSYDKYKDLSNITVIGRPDLYIQYLGFNLGHFDKSKNESVTDRDTPLQDINVRKALSYALNIDEIATAYYNGLRQRANGHTPPIFKKYYDETLEGYPYNPEKARELLKKAGYEDTNGDGIVDKDGKNLELKFATMAGSDVAEPIAQAFLQYWKEIGVNVTLTTGRLLDFNLFYDKLEANEDDIDIYMAAWGVGTSLDPSASKARDAMFNFTRFTSEENDKLLEAVSSSKGLSDLEYKVKAYKDWQKYFVEQAVEVPLMFRYKVSPVNKNVKHDNLYTDTKRSNIIESVVNSLPEKAK
ncbi:ABC transporter substrate-binding protein [Streptobacillus moniliformis]|uniref:Extracellular solute-binding protein family 5 n=1 Tax=Streptobacillus moniliformis (strain ATCC 14647 / DSM 12112 / NCTC 10651 / 9901) TaxID=519441 RepID=D1AV17_STRM9|nr:ABC transporter substrate-binding protein [Streptobacillus moniliformis]ACZ01577.1 extracellular solute-binding protein family 5 [Streptobacillus moniliformis DSM 12112]AVL43428.1 ABC transporter substrate-binding protein [Streptobacillus moniliformis]SQA13255.1 Oligopeptide-binding protein AppA precursor [Streptobacillus moniliformis]